MDVLGLEDIIPLEEFAGKRREFASAHRRYLDRYRRVRLGPTLTLVFENRQTLWFRVQEVLRLTRLSEKRLVAQLLHGTAPRTLVRAQAAASAGGHVVE